MSAATPRAIQRLSHLVPRRLRTRVLGEAALFTLANGLIAVLAAIPKGILAATLTVHQFGSFSFATTVLTYAALLFEFGLFLPAARHAALADTTEKKHIIGSALVLYIPVGLGMVAFLFFFSFGVDSWFHVTAGESLRIVAPLAFFMPFIAYIGLQLAQGVERLYVFSVTTLLAQVVFVAALAAAFLASLHVTVTLALVLRTAAGATGALALALWLRPAFSQVWSRIRALIADARAYGFRVYVGHVLGSGTYNMDVLMLAAFTDTRAVAVYTLAGAIATAAGYPIAGLANALFSNMAEAQAIRQRWITMSWAAGLIGLGASWIASLVCIGTIFPDAYGEVQTLVIPLGVAGAIAGVTRIYNTFLSAHGLGRELQNASLVLAVTNVLLNFALIPSFGAMGAAIASALALLANLIAHILSYRRQANGPARAADAVGR